MRIQGNHVDGDDVGTMYRCETLKVNNCWNGIWTVEGTHENKLQMLKTGGIENKK